MKPIMQNNFRYCKYCGKLIDSNAAFCTFCGASASLDTNCNHEELKTYNDKHAKYESENSIEERMSAERYVVQCEICGKTIDADSTFCKHCGASVATKRRNTNKSSLFRRFQSLSKGRQIFIIFWLIDICIMVDVLLFADGYQGCGYFMAIAIHFPFFILCFKYIFGLCKKKRKLLL